MDGRETRHRRDMEAKREGRTKRKKDEEKPGGKEEHNDGKRRNRRRAVRADDGWRQWRGWGEVELDGQ